MSKNIKISSELLNSAISLLEGIDVEDYDADFVQLFGYVSHSLNKKRPAPNPRRPSAMTGRNDDGHTYRHPRCDQCDALPF